MKERDRVTEERDKLRKAYERVLEELQLLRRRIFVATAERVDTSQLLLDFAKKQAELDALAGALPKEDVESSGAPPGASSPAEPGPGGKTPRPKPTGRRDVSALEHLPQERLELTDPDLEGKAERIGFEESSKLGYRRGGLVRVVIARAKYKVAGPAGVTLDTTPMPPESFQRSLAAPSLIAHVITDKFCDGLPLYRQEDRFKRLGVDIDRGTMSRWVADAGALLGATVIEAMRKDAFATAFCLATDATGVAIQPEPAADKKRQPCRRGHFFVVIADRDHVFFDYQPRETSAAVGRMFHGFSGYIQADAKSVYDVLFVPPPERPPPQDGADPDLAERFEVGCWSHARRKFWEAAIAKVEVAREALFRIARFFERDAGWKGKPPATIKDLRNKHLRPELESFFAWAEVEYAKVKDQRGSLRSAFGYAVRQRNALMRVLDDGRLKLDNNRSERALRAVAVGRKNWLFIGSDDHADAAGHLLSAIASARLHYLDPEVYLRELLRVLPHWPKSRHLELSPKYWATTRTRLDAAQLAAELGPLTVPPVPEQEPVTN
ncbi:MAG: IS66 family transposase [Deltaproteobacteria bacterium]|nr:IS66 family transposase [Deltaproteobacteria bacterium]